MSLVDGLCSLDSLCGLGRLLMASRWTICGLGHPLLFLLLFSMIVDFDVVGDLLVVPEVGLARRHVVALPAHHALVPTATDVVTADTLPTKY